MLENLFYLPHRVAGIPLFGWGWLLAVWLVVSVVWIGWLVRRQGWNADTRSYLPVMVIVAVAIALVLPIIEARDLNGDPIGLPIRGYGSFLLLGTLCGVGLAVLLAREVGISSDFVLSLAFATILTGFVGARLFYVIEYWEDFAAPTWRETAVEIIKFTEGGIVVYGAALGGFLAYLFYTRSRGLPLLVVGDVIAPAMIAGLALGRIGCLMNGCCYGGVCSDDWGITFPIGSPPYVDQLADGQLLGFALQPIANKNDEWLVEQVRPGSPAEQQGMQPGQRIVGYSRARSERLRAFREGRPVEGVQLSMHTADGQQFQWQIEQLPRRSRAVYPTQIYSAVNAALICLFLWSYFPFRRRDGEVLAWLLTIYPCTRFTLEIIRVDEPGIWGTSWSVSQWGSLLVLAIAAGLWIVLWKRPRRITAAAPQPQ